MVGVQIRTTFPLESVIINNSQISLRVMVATDLRRPSILMWREHYHMPNIKLVAISFILLQCQQLGLSDYENEVQKVQFIYIKIKAVNLGLSNSKTDIA